MALSSHRKRCPEFSGASDGLVSWIFVVARGFEGGARKAADQVDHDDGRMARPQDLWEAPHRGTSVSRTRAGAVASRTRSSGSAERV